MRRTQWLGLGLIALGGGIALITVLGPLLAGTIHYRVSSLMLSQLRGADAVALAVVAPLCLAVGVAALRGHRAAPVLALGPALYTLYMVAEMIVGPDYGRFGGNNERFFPLLLGVFLLAGAVAATAWNAIDLAKLPRPTQGRRRLVAGVFAGLATLLVVGRYAPVIAAVVSARPLSADYTDGPTIFWTIALEDLGLVIPVMIAVAIVGWRGTAWAVRAGHALAGWAALVPVAVAGMGWSMYLDHQPSASVGAAMLLTVMAVLFLAPAALLYPPLLRAAHPAHDTDYRPQRRAPAA